MRKPATLHECDQVKQWLDIAHFGRRRCAFRCDAHQRQLFSNAGLRVLLNCSRQSGKSTVAALKAVHTAAHRAGCTIVITAPIKQQTRELIRKIRHFASMASLTQSAEKFGVQFRNGSRVVGVAADEDTIRGFSSVALVIVDEAARVADDVFHAVLPMLAVSSGSMWMMSTPKGKRGFFYNEWINELSGWLRHLVRAAECPRIPDLFLEEQRQRLGVRLYAQEFECQFMDNNLGYFDPDSVRKVIKKEIKPLDF